MNEKIRQIEICFRNIGYVVIPAELVYKLIMGDIRIEFTKGLDGSFQREAICDYLYIEIKKENIRFDFKEMDDWFDEEDIDLVDILGNYDVTHFIIRYVDNSKEEFMIAWSELEEDFLSSTCVRNDEANRMLCITIDLDKFQFDKHIGTGE